MNNRAKREFALREFRDFDKLSLDDQQQVIRLVDMILARRFEKLRNYTIYCCFISRSSILENDN